MTLRVVYLVLPGFSAIASGFFSGSETALIGIQQERVHQLARSGKRGLRVQQLVGDPDRLLSTLLVANNLVNILGAAVATTLFIDLVGETWGPWVSTAAVTAVILVVGEITPKTLAARHPEKFSLTVAPTIWRLSAVLGPVAKFFTMITRGLFRLFGVSSASPDRAVTEDDIRALSELGLAAGGIESVEHEIIDALFTLADRPVREVMTPRVDIEPLEEPVDIERVRDAVATTGHSRYPVSAGNLDELRGVLYVKDLLQLRGEPTSDQIKALLRKPMFVVAELVGELQDEYDPGTPDVTRIGPQQWLADGRLPIEDLVAAIGVEMPAGPYTTVGGMLMAIAGRIPAEGDQLTLDGLRFAILQMDRNRVDRVQIEKG